MRHKHHILQRYKGGTDDASNIVELTPICHSMWHWCEWKLWRDSRDYCAHKMLLGDVKNPEFRRHRNFAFASDNGKIGGVRVHQVHPSLASDNNKKQRSILASQGKTIAEQSWEIVTPTGEVLVITNLAKYCREHQLQKSHMVNVSKGNRKQHKGFKCKKL